MEQKPGADYYGRTTFLLIVLIAYIMNTFDQMFVTAEELLKGAEGSNNIFSANLSMMLLFVSSVIVIERYISRADVRVRIKSKSLDADDKSFFNKQQMFHRASTQRSMTVKLKTMKTSDIDMTGQDSQDFLAAFSEQ